MPLIGITCDTLSSATRPTVCASLSYVDAVHEAGGTPLLLPPVIDQANHYAQLCDGLILTGGDDPDMTPFGKKTDPRVTVMDPRRQAFECALIRAHESRYQQGCDTPLLGVCLGMQLMGLIYGATLEQYMPDRLGEAGTDKHRHDARHTLVIHHSISALNLPIGPTTATVASHHKQACANSGQLRLLASAEDGTIEAIDNPDRKFFLGVQWHPERTDLPGEAMLGKQLIRRFVSACISQ